MPAARRVTAAREDPEARVQIDKDLVAASATPLVLSILARGDSYGYAIATEVRQLSAGRMEWSDGMLYPLLHRLERSGYVRSSWQVADTGRRRKSYAITDAGRAVLDERRQQWSVVSAALDRAWRDLGAGPAAAPGTA